MNVEEAEAVVGERKPPTKSEGHVLDCIVAFLGREERPPNIRELCVEADRSSSSTVHGALAGLEAKGYIRQRDPVTGKKLPIQLVDGEPASPSIPLERVLELIDSEQKLSSALKRVLAVVARHWHTHQFAPMLDEICSALGVTSKGSVHGCVTELTEREYLEPRQRGVNRNIRLSQAFLDRLC